MDLLYLLFFYLSTLILLQGLNFLDHTEDFNPLYTNINQITILY